MFVRQINGIVRNSKKSFSLLHLVGLRPRVYYTLTNFRGGGKAMTEKCRPEPGLKPRVSRYTYERSTD